MTEREITIAVLVWLLSLLFALICRIIAKVW